MSTGRLWVVAVIQLLAILTAGGARFPELPVPEAGEPPAERSCPVTPCH
jgi:hypothetical protein